MNFTKLIYILFFMFFVLNTKTANAADIFSKKSNKNQKYKNSYIVKKTNLEPYLLGRIFIKIKKTKNSIIRKIKRKISKRKSKKKIMRSGFRKRNKKWFNILVFSGIIVLTVGILFSLLYFSIINSIFFTVSLIAIGVTTIVLALIYFSNRFIRKPNFK